jgi:hypothetical protein
MSRKFQSVRTEYFGSKKNAHLMPSRIRPLPFSVRRNGRQCNGTAMKEVIGDKMSCFVPLMSAFSAKRCLNYDPKRGEMLTGMLW